MSTPVNRSLRANADIDQLFRIAESRHLNEAEYQQYLALIPENVEQVAAAKEIMSVELEVVTKTVRQVLTVYPFAKFHELPRDKCTRDVSYVSAYATHSMLLADPDWFRDKLLIWFKTILQAFSYPGREERNMDSVADKSSYPEITAFADSLPKPRRAIYETYARLLKNYQEVLSPKAFALMQPHLQLAVDILASE